MGNVIVSNITRVATDQGGGYWGSTGDTPPVGAATLINATESLGSTSASIKCTSDSVVGTLYYYVSLSGTAPSITDLKAGTGAFKFGNTTSVLASINSFNVTGLTAEANYYSYFVQNNGSDSNVLESGIWTTLAAAVGLLYSQNFESAGWESEFTGSSTWSDNVAVVTNDPHSGTKSLRGNQIDTVTDGITGLVGESNPTLDWRGSGGNISGLTPNECHFDYWFKHDNYNEDLVDDGSGEGKLLFFVDDTYGVQAMYINNQLVGSGTLRLKYSNGGYGDSWATTNWGYTSLYLSNVGVSGGANGDWVKFTYYINYDESYIEIYVNDLLMKSNHAGEFPGIPANGRIYFDATQGLHTKGFQFFWARSANIDGSTDGTGYAAGWQIDDLAVYDTKQGV